MTSLTERCSELNEAELMRVAAPLYPSFALESFAAFLMFLFFTSVAIKLQAANNVKSPLKATWRLCKHTVVELMVLFKETMATLPIAPQLSLGARYRFCTNIDKVVAVFSACASLLSITRWLSINNVNGLRYMGYWCTCPLMMVELCVMIAPLLPFFLTTAFLVGLTTFLTLVMGYFASLMNGKVFTGDIGTYVRTWDLDDLQPTSKFWIALPSFAGITVLVGLVLPYLGMLFVCARKKHKGNLPDSFITLLVIVAFTWCLFPVWWIFSWEGQGILMDTKFNELGFMVLNMLAKGLFVLHNLNLTERHTEASVASGQHRISVMMDSAPEVLSHKRSMNNRKSRMTKALKDFDDMHQQIHKTMSDVLGDDAPMARSSTRSLQSSASDIAHVGSLKQGDVAQPDGFYSEESQASTTMPPKMDLMWEMMVNLQEDMALMKKVFIDERGFITPPDQESQQVQTTDDADCAQQMKGKDGASLNENQEEVMDEC